MASRNFTSGELMAFAGEVAVRNWRLLIRLSALSLLIVIVQGVLVRLFAPEVEPVSQDLVSSDSVDAAAVEAMAGISTIAMLSAVAAHLALIPAFTAWHRIAILNNPDRGNGSVYGWDRREWRHLLVYVAMFTLVVIMFMLMATIGGLLAHPAAIAFSGLIAIVFWALSWAALGLALPATALGHPVAVGTYLRVAKMDLARIAGALIGVSLICMMIGIAAALVIGLPLMAIFKLGLVFEILAFASYLSLVITVAVWSRAYAMLFKPEPPL